MKSRLFITGVAAVLTLAGCGLNASGQSASGRISVAAAENFWGSIATQLGGDHASVTSVIVKPDTDPHAYEPTPQDGRIVAQAQYVIANGAGYDPWMQRLVDANPSASRHLLTVATLAARREGDNPHMWYYPAIVSQVVDRIASDLAALDPADAGYFQQRASAFHATSLAHYDAVRAAIRLHYGGVPVGATESIFVDLAKDLGLDLVTPYGYMRAISEGGDPSAGDKSTFDSQISGHQIKVLVFNRQNSTPDIQALVDKANAQSIPVVAITETLDPAIATFEDWQAGQMDALQQALARATGT